MSSDSPTESTAAPKQGNPFDAIMPVVLFLVFNSTLGLPWAIVAATLWSVKVTIARSRSGVPIGKFLPLVTLAIIGRGIIGVVTDSEAVYFGLGIATKYAIGVVLIGSVLVGKNLLAKYAPLLFGFDEPTQQHRAYREGMNVVAIVVGVYYLISASFDIWLFNNSSVNGYVWIRLVVNWFAGMVTYAGAVLYLNHRMKVIPDFPGLLTMLEERVEAQAEARKSAKKR